MQFTLKSGCKFKKHEGLKKDALQGTVIDMSKFAKIHVQNHGYYH